MPEFIACPSCALRHTRRPDGLCPRCKAPTNVEASQGAAEALAAAAAAPSPISDVVSRPMPPPMPSLSTATSIPKLGGLAQSARTKEIRNARSILLVIGVLTLLLNGFLFSQAPNEVQVEIDKQIKELPAGQVADPEEVAALKDEWVRATRVIYGGGVAFGLGFIILGVLAPKHPVPCTIGGLVLYIGGYAIFGYLNPPSLTQGILIKIIIVSALFKAMQAAIAHQKELGLEPSGA